MHQHSAAICGTVQIHLFSSVVFPKEKKDDKKNWPIKIPHMFLILECSYLIVRGGVRKRPHDKGSSCAING